MTSTNFSPLVLRDISSIPFDEFYKSETSPYKKLLQTGHPNSALKCIYTYLEMNKSLDKSQKCELYFSAGEIHACNNSYHKAIECFRLVLETDMMIDKPKKCFVQAIIGFLSYDKKMIKINRNKLKQTFAGDMNQKVEESLDEFTSIDKDAGKYDKKLAKNTPKDLKLAIVDNFLRNLGMPFPFVYYGSMNTRPS